MKKLLTFLGVLICLGAVSQVRAEDIKRTPSDIATWQKKGSTDVALGISSGGIPYNTDGLVNIHESFPFVTAPSTIALYDMVFANADQLRTAATNFSLTNPGALTGRQPQYGSPIWAQLWFNQTFSTAVYFATITISGIDTAGSSRTVNLTLSTNAVHNVTTGWAFNYVSSISVGVMNSTAMAGHGSPMHLTLGTTNQIGLANDIRSAGDIYAAIENNTYQSSVTASGNYNTWTPNILSNYDVTMSSMIRNRYELKYRAVQGPPRKVFPDRTNINP